MVFQQVYTNDWCRNICNNGNPVHAFTNAAFTLQILVFTPVSDPPCSSMKLPRKANVSNSLSIVDNYHYFDLAHELTLITPFINQQAVHLRNIKNSRLMHWIAVIYVLLKQLVN
ncbi:unnamed protein product [Schistosoma guineensis]|nr:unnamed protein product [Schistosoma guineensis]